MYELTDSSSTGAVELFGAILVALIAGVVSLVGLIISKEQKLSEFREQWISSLRAEISSLLSHALMINAYCHMFMKKINEEYQGNRMSGDEYLLKLKRFYDDNYKDYVGMNTSSTRIMLRLNQSEHEAAELLRKMKELENLFGAGPVNLDEQKVPTLVDAIEQFSQPLLKKEWNRVKAGEPTYRLAKRLCIIISSVLAVIFLFMVVSVLAFLFGFVSGPKPGPEMQCNRTCTSLPQVSQPGQSISVQQQCAPVAKK
jgi:hypothetical protein